jgi:hypothetical protein
MANQDDFLKVHGLKALGEELRDLSRGKQNVIFRPGLRKGAAEIRKQAKRDVKADLYDKGVLHKEIKSKVFTAKKKSKGVVARIGIMSDSPATDKFGTPVAKYAAALEKQRGFLNKAHAKAEKKAVAILVASVQEELNKFHAKKAAKAAAKAAGSK